MKVEKQSDDTSSDDCTRKAVDYRKERVEKNIYINKRKEFFWLDQESNFVFGVDKRSSYVILFNSRRWIDLIA